MRSVRWPPRAEVVGTPISMTSYEEVLDVVAERPPDRATVVCVCTVHSVMTARRRPELARALHDADVTTPDGVPLVWALRAMAHRGQTRVYGPDLMVAALARGVPSGWRHYFYGATASTLSALRAAAERRAPGIVVAGAHAPPFRALSRQEELREYERIRAARPDVVWVGLGMPKQELWMHRAAPHLPGVALLGVGAAFDFLAGTKRQAPRWLQRAGLEWLFRLAHEPRRLWRRYVFNNPAYLVLLAAQLARQRLIR